MKERHYEIKVGNKYNICDLLGNPIQVEVIQLDGFDNNRCYLKVVGKSAQFPKEFSSTCERLVGKEAIGGKD